MVHIESETEDLKVQLQTKDMVISDLERELSESLQQNKKVTDVLCPDLFHITKNKLPESLHEDLLGSFCTSLNIFLSTPAH